MGEGRYWSTEKAKGFNKMSRPKIRFTPVLKGTSPPATTPLSATHTGQSSVPQPKPTGRRSNRFTPKLKDPSDSPQTVLRIESKPQETKAHIKVDIPPIIVPLDVYNPAWPVTQERFELPSSASDPNLVVPFAKLRAAVQTAIVQQLDELRKTMGPKGVFLQNTKEITNPYVDCFIFIISSVYVL